MISNVLARCRASLTASVRTRHPALLVAAALIVSGCTWITNGIANKVYSNLQRPYETEAPATFIAYPSSPQTEAIIGGEGRGIDCSIPAIGDLAFSQAAGVSDIRLRFRQACVNHDFCYRHGLATYGYTQNDCDLALQESAFRLCRQIQASGGEDAASEKNSATDPYRFCETEAKKVLLGVALGGSGSYKGAGRSTYFEYDPMPAHADNYVISRALPSDWGPSDPNNLGIRSFWFRRNAVTMYYSVETAGSDHVLDRKNTLAAPFPLGRVATPPQFAEDNSGAPFAALARDGFTDTSLEVERLNPEFSAPKFLSLDKVMKCKSDRGWFDCDVSVGKIVRKDDTAEVVSLTHRGTLPSGTGPKLLEHRLDRLPESSYIAHDLDSQNVHNAYRFLVHDVLIEKNAQGNATHAWVLARGVGIDPAGHYLTDDPARNFSTQVLATRQKLGDGQSEVPQRFMLDATEKNEPLSLVRVNREGANALIGVDWREDDDDRRSMTPRLKTWLLTDDALPGAGTPVELMKETRDCYLEIPPIIARFPQINDAQMFFPRFTTKPQRDEDCAKPDETADPLLRFDVLFARFHLDAASRLKVVPAGGFLCDIDLAAQYGSRYASPIREQAARSHDQTPGVDAAAHSPAWDAAIIEMRHRWRMSQVIASARTSKTGEQEVALTAVFNGFTGMTFQALFHIGADQNLVLDRVAGGERFIKCQPRRDLEKRSAADSQTANTVLR
ncbi:hypothetical protein [Caballeronia sp. GACF4]|uniref:hypothetical protein n=1 Tax=Caballeronia sp. GACF4 TaxID=2921763 RepID=UPI00202832E0|nr:hypothetical protein [Caballeronia sp. GACF4]